MAALTRDDSGKYPAWAWPGGYPIYYFTADDATLCPACANGEHGSEARENHEDKQWRLVACDVHWEGESVTCDHCGALIESAHGGTEGGA